MEKPIGGQKTICIPIASEVVYGEILEEIDKFCEYLQEKIELHPELFPSQISDGYRFYGMTYSQKQEGFCLSRQLTP